MTNSSSGAPVTAIAIQCRTQGTMTDAPKPRVFSGIQPTGEKTLGNYSGGFRQYAQTQETHDAFFCIVDLHSISVEYDPAELRQSTLDLAAMLFATGLDAERSTVFCQSQVTAHAEAAWLLAAVTSYGQLGRMTQFKEKAAAQEFVSAALFTYPVLMAGDILLYQTDAVPVGDDQRHHLELTRDVAQRFNFRFGETFRIPEAIIPEIGGRIMDLQEPTNKMSTTLSSEQGAVFIADDADVIRKKFKSAVTDSEREIRYDPAAKPGVSNLLEIMSVATGEPIEALEQRFDGAGYGDLKEAVATRDAKPSAAAAAGCPLHSARGNIKHVIYIQFDNTHFRRDNPNVPSDLEQMPNLLNFITGNGTLLSNDHTVLISHTAGGILSSLTGVYPDRHGQIVSNSNVRFNGTGFQFPSSFGYWTDPIVANAPTVPNMVTPTGANAPAPWVPYTRAGCDFGAVATANAVLEKPG